MKDIFWFCLIVCSCGCSSVSEQATIDMVSRYKVSEGDGISAEVVKVGETLPQTKLTQVTVRTRRGPYGYENVLSAEKLSVGQKVKLVNVYFQASDTCMRNYDVVIIPKE